MVQRRAGDDRSRRGSIRARAARHDSRARPRRGRTAPRGPPPQRAARRRSGDGGRRRGDRPPHPRARRSEPGAARCPGGARRPRHAGPGRAAARGPRAVVFPPRSPRRIAPPARRGRSLAISRSHRDRPLCARDAGADRDAPGRRPRARRGGARLRRRAAAGDHGAPRMIIRRVRVRCFRGLGDEELAFAPGLNVVRGRNDAGKSTLHLAFSAALFPVRPSEAKSYRPWGEADGCNFNVAGESAGRRSAGEVTLEFEADGRRYELQKDFASQKTLLRVDGGEWETSKDVAARVGALLGFGSLALFRATAHIGQWQLAPSEGEAREIGAHLSRIMTGGDGDAVRVLKSIADWVRRQEVGLRGRPATAPGPLKRGQDRLKALADERQRLAAEVKEIEGAASEREVRAARISQLEGAVTEDEALLGANRRLLELDRRWDEVGRRGGDLAARLERIDTAARALAAAEQDAALHAREIPDDVLSALQQAEARAFVLRQQLDAAEASQAQDPSGDGPAATGSGPAGPRLLAALAAASAVAAIALVAAHHQTAGIVAVLAAAAAGAAFVIVRGRANADDRRAALEARERAEQAGRALAVLGQQ